MPGLKIDVPSYVLEYQKGRLRKVLRQAGQEVARVARNLIKGTAGTGVVRPGRKQASAPGQPPVSQTGKLASSISVKPNKDGSSVTVKDSAFYAVMLEGGAKGGGGRKGSRNRRGKPQTPRVLEPRHYLSAALEQRSESISERIRESILNDIAFRKMK